MSIFKGVNRNRCKFITDKTRHHNLSMTVYSMSQHPDLTSHKEVMSFFEFVDSQLGANIAQSGDVRALSNICYGFAKSEVNCGANLFEAVDKEAERIARDGNVQEIINLLWAFARMGFQCREIVDECLGGEMLEKICKEGSCQELANLVWALAVMESPKRCENVLIPIVCPRDRTSILTNAHPHVRT